MDQRPRFIHAGCGRSRRIPWVVAGWQEIRLDIDPAVEPDVVASLIDMSVVAGATVDAVFSAHNLEHLDPTEVPRALAEFRRVLKPTGFALLVVPDLQSVAGMIAQERLDEPLYESPNGPIAAIDIIYGQRGSAADNPFMVHRTGFTARTLLSALKAAGFDRVIIQRHFYSLWAIALAGPEAVAPHSHPAVACAPTPPVPAPAAPALAD